MAPVYEINVEDIEPMSRTYQYRKVMKPMLERKRRARINKCLDELKDLMVGALQHEGESITKLEKADVLELTVTHLKKLKRHNALAIPAASHSQEKFTSGFRKCASEVSKFITGSPGVDMHVSNRLLGYLSGCINDMEKITANTNHSIQSSAPSPPTTPITVSIPSKMYTPPASPDTTRSMQMSPATSHIHSSSTPPSHLQQSSGMSSVHPAYIRVPKLEQTLLVQTSMNPINITYKVANHHHLIQQQQQQPQQFQQSSPHHQSPPTPPLSVGAPSPVQSLRPGQVSSVSPNPTALSPVPRTYQSPVYQVSTDGGPVWRPW